MHNIITLRASARKPTASGHVIQDEFWIISTIHVRHEFTYLYNPAAQDPSFYIATSCIPRAYPINSFSVYSSRASAVRRQAHPKPRRCRHVLFFPQVCIFSMDTCLYSFFQQQGSNFCVFNAAQPCLSRQLGYHSFEFTVLPCSQSVSQLYGCMTSNIISQGRQGCKSTLTYSHAQCFASWENSIDCVTITCTLIGVSLIDVHVSGHMTVTCESLCRLARSSYYYILIALYLHHLIIIFCTRLLQMDIMNHNSTN